MLNPDDFVITRRRKKYRFAQFANLTNCYELDQWTRPMHDEPLSVEIGAGTALFSVELAARHPRRRYVAIDVKGDRLQKGARLASERGLTNISFVRARADQLAEVVADGTVDELWLTFSDPFPKKRAAKHRLTHPRFLALYRQALASDGTLRQKTDNHDLFDWSLEQFVTDGWHLTELSYDLHESTLDADYKVITTFETKFIGLGLPIYFVSANC